LKTSLFSHSCSAAEERDANVGVGALAEGAAFPATRVIVCTSAKSEVKKKFYPADKLRIT